MSTLIRNGRLIDPATGTDGVTDLLITDDGLIGSIGAKKRGSKEIDADGLIVCAGLVDLGVNFREPGETHKTTIASETAAALAGGVTSICLSPDTIPAVDTPATVNLISSRCAEHGLPRVAILGALTQALGGTNLSAMQALREAGCIGVSNATRPVTDTDLLKKAMQYAHTCGLKLFMHPVEPFLGLNGLAAEGYQSTRLGLPAVPQAAEPIAVSRLLLLMEEVPVPVHFCRVTSPRSIQMIHDARRRGIQATLDVGMPYLLFNDTAISDYDSTFLLQPPLPTEKNSKALKKALVKKQIHAICSDHQPQDTESKSVPFCSASPGLASLELLLPMMLELTRTAGLDMSAAIDLITRKPAEILDLPAGVITEGRPADLCLFDPDHQWTVDNETLYTQGCNAPWQGRTITGRVTHTFVAGRLAYQLKT